ncbi:uncharacterized acetyltransferase At3g50280-like [Lotus japonicus]|uniref:uncharacterized acetyltransferase At3g50280-like n=1 Tax=Lotus japonicus TaxID=34305 RepID=UPI0025850AC7|nr:uncharacterized acetyltransferase At3g50280-like [Lotus japonicus]
MSSSSALTILSNCTVFPDQKSTMGDLKLSISDLNMLLSHYIQKGCLFTTPLISSDTLITHLINSLSSTLSLFPPLAGRFITDADGYVFVSCNDAGADFIHASAVDLTVADLLSPIDVPQHLFKQLFPFHRKISHSAHSSPVMAIQVTDLADGIFIGCAVSHAVVDGTSLWNFFNTFADVSRGVTRASNIPDFRRESMLISKVPLRLPEGELTVTFNADEPLRERIFSFSRQAIQNLKAEVNNRESSREAVELSGKLSNDAQHKTVTSKEAISRNVTFETTEISSFQSLCALTWKCVTRARCLEGSKTTTFRMAVNIRHRLDPKLSDRYFGNAIQSVATCSSACEVESRDLRWIAEQLNKSVKAYDSAVVRRAVENWEREPKCFELGNHDGATVQMGSSPRFPMYDNDFGWGRPLAVRSGGANKFDGKISAFPGKDGGGAVDLEMVLAPQTMARLECDPEFMLYVSSYPRHVLES